MEKTIKFVKIGETTIVCGKNHACIYGEFQKVANGLYLVYLCDASERRVNRISDEHKPERFHGTVAGLREYFTKVANA